MPKPSNAIDNACVARLGYEYIGGQWLEKGARAPAASDDEIDEEAEMDVPLPSPHVAPSPPPYGTRSFSKRPAWYTDLSQRVDSLSLDLRAFSKNHLVALTPLIIDLA